MADLDDTSLTVFVHHYLGQVHCSLGEYPRAIAYYRKNLALIQGERLRERFGLPGLAYVTSCAYLTVSLVECGAFAEGRGLSEEGVRIAEAADHPFSRVLAYWAMGWRSLRQGRFHQAIPVLERTLALTQVMQTRLQVPTVASLLGAAYALAERIPEALLLLEQGVEQAAAMGYMLEHTLHMVWLGEASLLAGRLAEALTQAQRALDFCRAHRKRGHEAYALWLLGEIAARREPPDVDEAVTHYCQALTVSDELDMRPLQAHCHRGVGTLYAKMGRQEQARAELSTAIALYRAMDMSFWLPQVKAALAGTE